MAKLTGTRRAARLVRRSVYLLLAPWVFLFALAWSISGADSFYGWFGGYGLTVNVYPPEEVVQRGVVVRGDWLGLGSHVRLETATIDADDPAKISGPYHALAYLLNMVPAIAVVVLAVFVILVARRIERGRPFNELATSGLVTLGVLCTVTGLLINSLRAYVAHAYISQLGLHSTEHFGDGTKYWTYDPGSGDFSWPWLALALCLFVLAVAFRVGRQAERDTEGLV